MSDLTASIPIVGILQPLVVVPDDQDGFVVIVGHRRRAAAIELGLTEVPCIVADNPDDAEQIAVMLAENLHRQSLTVTEEAKGYQQLALLDWEPERIAKVAGRSTQHVTDSLKLTTLPSAAQEAANDGQLDLVNAAQLAAEFGDDPDTMATTLEKGTSGHWGIQHALAEATRKRDTAAAAQQLRDALVLEGVKITSRPKGWPYQCAEAAAADLRDADKRFLDPDEVKTAPGFRAFIDTTGAEPHAVVYCLDPDEWGYRRLGPTTYVSDHDKAIRAQKEAERAARLDALNIAADVGKTFLAQRYHLARPSRTST